MNTRLFAVLFTAFFLIGVFPVLFVQSFGFASAGITAGFMATTQNLYHVAACVAIGLVSAWAGSSVILVLPLCSVLMLILGALATLDAHLYPAIQYFIVGAIILFAMSLSLLRAKGPILFILPVAALAYFAGSDSLHAIPAATMPLFYLMGIVVSDVMTLAMGVALGITLADNTRETIKKLKTSAAFATFLSLF